MFFNLLSLNLCFQCIFQGCASVSLADFDPKDVISIRWYNVLSFKFMQPDTNTMQSNTTVPSKKSSSSSADTMGENVTITYSQTETVTHSETTQIVSYLIILYLKFIFLYEKLDTLYVTI
jgi:hypothetical protein